MGKQINRLMKQIHCILQLYVGCLYILIQSRQIYACAHKTQRKYDCIFGMHAVCYPLREKLSIQCFIDFDLYLNRVCSALEKRLRKSFRFYLNMTSHTACLRCRSRHM